MLNFGASKPRVRGGGPGPRGPPPGSAPANAMSYLPWENLTNRSSRLLHLYERPIIVFLHQYRESGCQTMLAPNEWKRH